MDYADDVLFHDRPKEIQRVLDCLFRGEKVGLLINYSKTEIININNENAGACVINGKIVQHVERFTYLGTSISKDVFNI